MLPNQKIVFLCFLLLPFLAKTQDISDEEKVYAYIKLSIICKSVEFVIAVETQQDPANLLDCQSLNTLEQTIPERYPDALHIFRVFKSKKYLSYGKGKLNTRLDKLIQDLGSELLKLKKDDNIWEDRVKIFLSNLEKLKDDGIAIAQGRTPTTSGDEEMQSPDSDASTKNSFGNMVMIYFASFFVFMSLIFLLWNTFQLQKKIDQINEIYSEKYSRLDNRLDFSAHKSDLVFFKQELDVVIKKLENVEQKVRELSKVKVIQQPQATKVKEKKISSQQLHAQRTTHLEEFHINPEVQIYYAKPDFEEPFFPWENLQDNPSQEHIYKLEINLKNPAQAVITIVNRDEYHDKAMLEDEKYLSLFCEYVQHHNNPSKIITNEAGILNRNQDGWELHQKIKISLEA